jgi:hypothetical protein
VGDDFSPQATPGRLVIGRHPGLANFGEVFWVSLQQWRGVPAHFNFSTPFDEAAFSGAGYLIRLTAAVIMIVTVWTFFSLHAPRSVKWAIRVGMVLLVVSQLFGLLTVLNGLTKVRDPQTGAFLPAALESAAIFGAAGAMKVPHALALHAMQVLPLLAWLLRFAPWREEQRTRLVIAGSLGYSGLVGASAFQTFSGLAPLDLRLPVALVGGVSLVLLGTVYALALVGLWQSRTHAAARA